MNKPQLRLPGGASGLGMLLDWCQHRQQAWMSHENRTERLAKPFAT
jgi:hypothetical protein